MVSIRRRARRIARRWRARATRLRADLPDLPATARSRARTRLWRGRRHDTAVALHLYYPELWPGLASYLERVCPDRADLVVTLPREHRSLAPTIRSRFPGARCLVVPNRGRDVLPFSVVAAALDRLGYVGVLKIHAKRSVHSDSGDTWRDTMLDELLPSRPETVEEILAALRRPDTGMVGPSGTYFPLSTYWTGNAATVRRLLAPHVDAASLDLLDQPDQLGFFAGTMFWVRLDAVAPLLHEPARAYVREPTPKDGTLAHALERAFCVLPELTGRSTYESDGTTVAPRARSAAPVPDWYRESARRAWEQERAAASRPATED
jgi:lipopolysaccharide biosynthesis protein